MAIPTHEAYPQQRSDGIKPGDQLTPVGRPLPAGIGEARKHLLSVFGDNVGRREASKRGTRLAIRVAAFELFQRDGIDHVTVEQIASKADISPRTFFNYFATKEECVVFPYQLMAPSLRLYLIAQPPELRPMEAMEEALATLVSDVLSKNEVAAAIKSAVNLHRSAPSLSMADASQKVHWEQVAHVELVNRGCDPFVAQVCAVAAIGIGRACLIAWASGSGDRTIDTWVREGFRGLQSSFS